MAAKSTAKKTQNNKEIPVMLPSQVNSLFRMICYAKNLKPKQMYAEVLMQWVEAESKKLNINLKMVSGS